MVNSGRTGRRPANETANTREAILREARELFAREGFRGTTMRAVASAAGVDPALVTHYFGSKQGLFEASLELPFNPRTVFPALVAGPPEGIGERLARFFVRTWSEPEFGGRLPALVRSVLTTPEAGRALEALMVRDGLGPALAARGLDEAELRASLAGSALVGMGMFRFILRIEPLASEPEERVIALLAAVIQQYLVEPLPARLATPYREVSRD